MNRAHGSDSTYTNDRCRCGPCRAAHNAVQAAGNASRAARLAADPTLAPHGKTSTYDNWGCRCDPCKRASTDRRRKRRAAS